MRCRICDNSDVGLSMYRPDHGYSTHYVKTGPVDYICAACYADIVPGDYADVLDEDFDEEGEDEL